MKNIEIKTIEELKSFDFTNLEVKEDIFIDIKLRLVDEELEYPIHINHREKGFSSKIAIKLALFGRSKVKIPVNIFVHKNAVDTATDFKALVLIMSKESSANVTPGLFIHEKNIRSASHGVVIKNIKDKDLVYLRARGLQKNVAREVIIGF